MQLLEAISIRRDETVDNHPGDLLRLRCNIEKKDFQRRFSVYHSWTKIASTYGVSERTVITRRKEFGMTILNSMDLEKPTLKLVVKTLT